MMDPFPPSWSSETVARWLFALAIVAILALSGLVQSIKVAARNAKPLPEIHGGQSGEIFKIRPTLKP